MKSIRHIIYFYLLCIGSAIKAAQPSSEGYIFEGERSVKITVAVMKIGNTAPYKQVEAYSWQRIVEPQSSFKTALDFVPITQDEYNRLANDASKKGIRLPAFVYLAPTRVLRGAKGTVVAQSGRRLVWPNGFVLQDGDILQILELSD